MNNLKQIGLGFMQYSQDYDERLPPLFTTGVYLPFPTGQSTNWDGVWYWMQTVYPYIKSTQVYVCPSTTGTFPTTTGGDAGRYWGGGVSYGYSGAWSPYAANTSLPIAKIQNPAEMPLFMDCEYYLAGPDLVGSQTWWKGEPTETMSGTNTDNTAPPSGRHFNRFNVAFADGHVKSLPLAGWYTSQATPLCTDPVWKKWAPDCQS